MKVWGTIHKHHRIIAQATGESEKTDASQALLECLEQIYKKLDLAEPVWVAKHARDLSYYRRTKFLPSDFLEPVSFDFFEIETIPESDD